VDPQRAVGRAGFEQQHARGWVFAQARREHAAGRAGADDDVVERFVHSVGFAVRVEFTSMEQFVPNLD